MSQYDTKLQYIFLGERLRYLIKFKEELTTNLILAETTTVEYKNQYLNDLVCQLFVIRTVMKELNITNINLGEYDILRNTLKENIEKCSNKSIRG